MATNLVIGYPHIPLEAVSVTPDVSFATDFSIYNLIDGRRSHLAELSSNRTSFGWTADLGSGNTASVDYFVLNRADLLRQAGVSHVILRGSSDNSTFSIEKIYRLNRTVADIEYANGEYLSRADDSDLEIGTNEVYMAFWYRPESLSNPVAASGLSKYYDGTDYSWYSRILNNGAFTFGFSGDGTVGDLTNVTTPNGSVTVNNWHMLEIAWDTTNHKAAVNAASWTSAAHGKSQVFNNTAEFRIGLTQGAGFQADGLMRDALVLIDTSGVIPSDTDRTWLYNSGSGRTLQEISNRGLLPGNGKGGFWPLNESSGTRRDRLNDHHLTDNNTVASLASTADTTLYGPSYNATTTDLVATFTATTAYRYWRIEYLNEDDNKIPHSKVYFGNRLDLGVDPDDITHAHMRPESEDFVSSNGSRWPHRGGQSVREITLTWRGVTDANLQTFKNKVAARMQRSGFQLITTSDHEVLWNYRVLHCRLTKWEHTKEYDDFNRITATFREMIG